jgi:choline dehydrogenase
VDGWDVIVVGSGSSGATLAARLSDDPGCRVLLIEAGPDFPEERSAPPAFLTGGAIIGEGGAGIGPPVPSLDWGYGSEPLPGGRRVALPRGRLVGGSSMVNGCVAARPRPADLDGWEQAGASGWGWRDMLPYLELVERDVPIMRYPPELWLPFQRTFVDACTELGFRYLEDLNAPDAWDGVVGPWPRNRRNEIRQGTLVTHIRRVRDRPNLIIRDNALVDRVLIDGGRASGVVYADRDGQGDRAHADRVVLCAGAYGSGPILLRSGIGPADELSALGIAPAVDLPVGRGLLEHPGMFFQLTVAEGSARGGWPAMAVAARGDGWWAIPGVHDEERGIASIAMYLGVTDGVSGTIRLRSASPADAPIIDHGYADVIEEDRFDGVWSDYARLLATGALAAIGARDRASAMPLRERLLRWMMTGAHPAGGCSIGPVVTPDLHVHGVERLAVADASVFPRHVSNNPNLTCHMIGERMAAVLMRDGVRYTREALNVVEREHLLSGLSHDLALEGLSFADDAAIRRSRP